VVPYIKEIRNSIKRVVKKAVDVRCMIPKKLDSFIKKNKDRLNTRLNTDIVYKINRKDWDEVYFGQTKTFRDTYKRIQKQHKKFFRQLLSDH